MKNTPMSKETQGFPYGLQSLATSTQFFIHCSEDDLALTRIKQGHNSPYWVHGAEDGEPTTIPISCVITPRSASTLI